MRIFNNVKIGEKSGSKALRTSCEAKKIVLMIRMLQQLLVD